MQIENRTVSTASGDGLGTMAGRSVVQATTARQDDSTAASAYTGGYDPSSRVSLSGDALLFLARTRKVQDKYPALTKDEWSNKLSPQLAAREYQAFGKYGEAGDHKAYYRAFIEYHDNLRTEDQNSLRYFGTRDAAVAGLRSVEYSAETGSQSDAPFQTLVSVLLDKDKVGSDLSQPTASPSMTTGDMFGWDVAAITYEDVSQTRGSLSEIEKFYAESF